MKRAFSDGTTHVLFEPQDFTAPAHPCARGISASLHVIARLAALVARPKVHLVSYHRLFAPNARARAGVVPRPKLESKATAADESVAKGGTTPMSWMARLKRLFAIDLTRCLNCGGDLQVIAVITAPGVTARILKHWGPGGRVQPRAAACSRVQPRAAACSRRRYWRSFKRNDTCSLEP